MTTLKTYVDRNGISQVEMARMLGVRQPSVNRYLKGQVPVPPVMQRLIDVTGGEVTANDFFILPKRKRTAP